MSNATELLRRALEAWDNPSMSMEIMFNEIRAFLDAEPEAEPVAWGYKDRSGEISACISRQLAEDAGTQGDYKIPLYTRPEPTRKPLSSDERLKGFIELRDNDDGAHLLSFLAGVRFAEKHHGLIPRRENS
jgi:hypothetical protein